jgi:hypothetical protein
VENIMNLRNIETEKLILVPVTLEITRSLMDKSAMDILPIINKSLEKDKIPSGFEALKAIMDWLSNQHIVKVVKADCLIDNKASARILEKTGMKEINRDNELIYWEYVKPVCN